MTRSLLLFASLLLLILASAACGGIVADPPENASVPTASREPDDACEGGLPTSPAGCGVCGHDCQGGACVDGVCQPVRMTTTPVPGSAYLAVDGAHIYLGNQATGAVERRALADMEAPHVLATGQNDIMALAAADGLVIWAKHSPAPPPTGKIMAVGAFGGEPWVIRDKLEASGVAYHDGWLYFTDFEAGLFRTQLEEGLDKNNRELLELNTINARGVTVHGQTVFWAAMNGTNSISSRKLGPGQPTVVLAENQLWPQSIHTDAARVYWISRAYGYPVGELRARSDAHPTPHAIVTNRPIVSTSLTGNATSVFWAEDDGHVYRLAK